MFQQRWPGVTLKWIFFSVTPPFNLCIDDPEIIWCCVKCHHLIEKVHSTKILLVFIEICYFKMAPIRLVAMETQVLHILGAISVWQQLFSGSTMKM